MRRRKLNVRMLWIVDPSLNTPEDQGVATILQGWDGKHRLFRPALRPGDGPDPDTGYDTDGIVIMGSAASVHDSFPWLQALSGWLRPVVLGERRLPLLGICFGHQLIAHLAGARVIDLAGEKRVGVESSRLRDSLLVPGRDAMSVVVSHREVVTQVPAGYRVTAFREGVEIDGLEHERLPIGSFQFHPEAREEFADRAGIAPLAIDESVRADSRTLLDAFLSRV